MLAMCERLVWRGALSILLAVYAYAPSPALAHQGNAPATIPVKTGAITLGTGDRPRVALSGVWVGEVPSFDPFRQPATVRIFGAFGGDSGTLRLDSSRWSRTKKGWRYTDPTGSVGGISLVELKLGKRGGRMRIRGGGTRWLYALRDGAEPGVLSATLQIGDHALCLQFRAPKRNKRGLISAKTSSPPVVYQSTWDGVLAIFERNGCTAAVCHGAAAQGNLDLRPENAYGQLVNRPSTRGGKLLVQPGSRQDSFLWEKLAAATEGYDLGGRGSPMPSGLPPLTAEELEAIRLWIQFGAPERGVVGGTEQLLGACLPPAAPQKSQAPAPPRADEGVQFHAPPWVIPPADPASGRNGEGEVCYATYFNVADRIPADVKVPCPEFWGGPTKTCFVYNRTELTQDPNSHHSLIHVYRGAYEPTWEPSKPGDTTGFRFRCADGPRAGAPCDPRVPDVCSDGGTCRGEVITALACIGYGPPDYGAGGIVNGAPGGNNSPNVGGSQQPFSRNVFPEGVYGVLPAEGVLVWNSHAFNLFETPQTNEQWWNIYFAPPGDRRFPARPIFDATDIFWCPRGELVCDVQVPPFQQREFCRTITMPVGARIFEFSAHTHQRGSLFRIWGPGIAESCRASGPKPCLPETSAPFFISTDYNDPTVLTRRENPWVLDDPAPVARRFKFCAVYDNGFTDPLTVKRNSTSVVPPTFGNLAPGGKCFYRALGGSIVDRGIACLNGPRRGQPCHGDDRACDSRPGANDGICDACPLEGGVTTDDEMFILLGTYFCQPGSDCDVGVCADGPKAGQRCDGDHRSCPESFCGPYAN